MKKAYVKDIVKEIKRTRKRYISIIAIVILGVAFFVGINASCPDMLNTFNKYINDYNVFDLNLISTVGFDNDDVETIKNIDKIDIWNYLKISKWKNSINLTISEMVNDIIHADNKDIDIYLKKYKKNYS